MPTPAILNPTKVIFLDIDGVLQCDRQDRFDHLRDGSFERLITEVRERCGYTDSAFDYLAKPLPNTYRYDFLAAAFDWEIDAVERLKKLITKHNAAIVLSTSWRLIGCRGMLLILGLYGLDKYLSGATLLETHFYDRDKDKLIDEHGSYAFSRKFSEGHFYKLVD